MVERVTHNPSTKGSNPATGAGTAGKSIIVPADGQAASDRKLDKRECGEPDKVC